MIDTFVHLYELIGRGTTIFTYDVPVPNHAP